MKNVNAEKKGDKLVEEYSEKIDGNEMIYKGTLNDYIKVCKSCAIYMVLFVIFLIISTVISSELFIFIGT